MAEGQILYGVGTPWPLEYGQERVREYSGQF